MRGVPELPDIELYLHALRPRVLREPVERVRIVSPFLLRSFEPPPEALLGREVVGLERLGKRIVFDLGNELFVVLHLMIAGRLRWGPAGAKVPAKIGLAAIDFSGGALLITEASGKKRASLHIVRGLDALREHDPGGLEPLTCTLRQFAAALRRENHTVKRTLTAPHVLAGIGNAYSDEILHAARLSPITMTGKLSDERLARLHAAMQEVLGDWTERLKMQFGPRFPGPGDITAFRPEFAVHGKFGQPCPACGRTVQRIRYADNETNYCPTCQTDGKILADRSLSRLLKQDWPRSVEEIE